MLRCTPVDTASRYKGFPQIVSVECSNSCAPMSSASLSVSAPRCTSAASLSGLLSAYCYRQFVFTPILMATVRRRAHDNPAVAITAVGGIGAYSQANSGWAADNRFVRPVTATGRVGSDARAIHRSSQESAAMPYCYRTTTNKYDVLFPAVSIKVAVYMPGAKGVASSAMPDP